MNTGSSAQVTGHAAACNLGVIGDALEIIRTTRDMDIDRVPPAVAWLLVVTSPENAGDGDDHFKPTWTRWRPDRRVGTCGNAEST